MLNFVDIAERLHLWPSAAHI